jgi:hypothetical protein
MVIAASCSDQGMDPREQRQPALSAALEHSAVSIEEPRTINHSFYCIDYEA